jgi:hypothetical protein
MTDLPTSRHPEKGRYVYDQLDGRPDDTLRILHLQPGSGEDALQCSLSLARCSDKPRYSALSYVWGSSKTTILVDNQVLSVPSSLSDFLRQLRHPVEYLPLWADAICVDQENLRERGHQVQLMGSIYTNATVVHAWLGEDTCQVASSLGVLPTLPATLDTSNKSGTAIQAVKSLRLGDPEFTKSVLNENTRNPTRDENFPVCERKVPESEKIRPCAPQPSTSALKHRQDPLKRTLKIGGNEILERPQAWKAMIDICHRKYWTRLWVVQEFILARSFVLCIGASQVSWIDFLRLAIFCGAHSRKAGSVSKEIRAWEERWKATYCTSCPIYPFTRSPLYARRKHVPWTLFALWQMQECEDPRDKVYALLSLAEFPYGCEIRPNYEQCVISLYSELCRQTSKVPLDTSALQKDLGVSLQQIQEHGGHFPGCLIKGQSGQVCSILGKAQALKIDTLSVEFSRTGPGNHSKPPDALRCFAKVSSAVRHLLRAIH